MQCTLKLYLLLKKLFDSDEPDGNYQFLNSGVYADIRRSIPSRLTIVAVVFLNVIFAKPIPIRCLIKRSYSDHF